MTSIKYESFYTANYSAVSTTAALPDVISRAFAPQHVQDYLFFAGGYNITKTAGANTFTFSHVLNSLGSVAGNIINPANDIPQPGGVHYSHVKNLPIASYTHKTTLTPNSNATASRGNHLLSLGGLNMVAENSLVTSASQTTTEADVLTVSYTPTDVGKQHLILMYCQINPPSSGELYARAYIDGSEKMIARFARLGLGANASVMFLSKKVTLTAGSHTFKITGQSVTANGGTLSNCYISIIQIEN